MKKTIYFPALNACLIQGLKDGMKLMTNNEVFGNLRFYEKDSLFHYFNFLISAGNFYRDKDFLKKIGVDLKENKELLILGDSGGYQIAKGVIKKNDIEELKFSILEWLEENSNYAMVLDIPLYSTEEFLDKEEKFKDSLNGSGKFFKFFYENKKNKTKFLNIIHGRNIRYLNEWYEMMKDFNFEGGIAIGSCSNSPIYYPLQSFLFLLKKGALEKFKNKKDDFYLLHFLGVANSETIIYLSYLQKYLDKNGYNIIISYDSSNASFNASKGINIIDNHFMRIHFNGQFTKNLNYIDDFDNVIFFNPFSFDRDLTFGDFLKPLFNEKNGKNGNEQKKTYFYFLTSIFNLLSFLRYQKFVDSFIIYGNYDLYSYLLKDKSYIQKFKILDSLFEAGEKEWEKILFHNKKLFLSEGKEIDNDFNLF